MFKKRRDYGYYSSYGTSSRRRLRVGRVAIIGVIIAVLIIAAVIVLNLTRIQLMFKGYSFSQASEILTLNSDEENEILSHDKMDHIVEWIDNSDHVEWYDEYERYLALNKKMDYDDVITYIDNLYENQVDSLKDLSYSEKEIWNLVEDGASEDDFQYLIDNEYSYDDLKPYRKVDGYQIQKIKEYISAYATYKDYNYAVGITNYPFIISSNGEPKDEYTITNPKELLTLVKKGFYLPNNYEPDLGDCKIPVAPDCENSKMTEKTANALKEMYDAAKKEGLELVLNSAYRSYETQVAIYNDFETRYGGQYAAEYVAKPGASEHQTGLGIDLTSQSVVDGQRITFGDTDEYKWVVENCEKYGFIIRFESGRDNITGIAHEPWHLRYVGKDVAKEIVKNNWTFEEYCLYKNVMPEIEEK